MLYSCAFVFIRYQKVVPTRSKSQRTITNFLKVSPTVIAWNTPIIPPSTYAAPPQPSPADPQPSPAPAAREKTPKEVIRISSERKDESISGNFRAATGDTKDKEEAEVTSADRAEAAANDALVFLPEPILPTVSPFRKPTP